MDTQTIFEFLGYVLPFIIGLFIKSPVAKNVPTIVVDLLEKLDAAAINEIYRAVESKQARRESAIDAIRVISNKYGVAVSETTAAAVVDYVTKRLKK